MTEEKRKRGRPRKIKIEGQLPESEIIEITETAKNYQPSKMEAMIEILQDVEMVKSASAKLKKMSSTPVNDPVSLEERIAENNKPENKERILRERNTVLPNEGQYPLTPDDVSLDLLKGNPVFKQAVENIEFVKPETLNPKGVAYDPFKNDRFKNKMGIK